MLLGHDAFTRLCLAREMLAEPSEDPRSIEAVAHAVQISPFHFIRQFEALFGSTPHQFRIQRRIHRAKHLLATGRLSVTETCFEVGMSSLGSFSDLFLRRVGDTPSAYQRRARTLVQVPGFPPLQLFPGCLSLIAQLPPGAFRNFREAKPNPASIELQSASLHASHPGDTYAIKTHQPHG